MYIEKSKPLYYFMLSLTSEEMYVGRNVEACLCSQSCSGEAVSLYLWAQVLSLQCACTILSYWSIRPCNMLPHCWKNGKIFGEKKITEPEIFVSIFSTTFIWNISLSKKKWARLDQKCILVFIQSTRYSCRNLTEIILSLQILEEFSKYEI